ncbi:MAG TPA: hypothetical protein VHW94_13555 [Candidatus Dormibacteraeota bacterium]|nr:hypothetical protein [Candidatus Dormibacteraeota bacterium]
MTTLLNRLGNLGLLVVACAFLVGGLAGAAVAQHLDRLSSNTTATQPAEQGNGSQRTKPQHGNQGHARNGNGHKGQAGGAQGVDPAESD